jgi:iron complex outermembrane recepter protein
MRLGRCELRLRLFAAVLLVTTCAAIGGSGQVQGQAAPAPRAPSGSAPPLSPVPPPRVPEPANAPQPPAAAPDVQSPTAAESDAPLASPDEPSEPAEPEVIALEEPVPAADTLPAPEASGGDEPPAGDGDIVVTGSRIKRSPELASSAPVDIIDRKALERSGASNAADVVQTLTAAQGSGYQGAGSPLNQGGGAVGTATINLRGLGAGATLVLVNGRRLVPSGGGVGENFGDISVIPLAAIERIEILKGGGSAIYGADAIGGVVNIITRSTWDGVRAEIDGQTTTRFDQQDVTVSGAFGAKSERSRVSISTSYLRRGELTSDKRDFSDAANWDQAGNPGTFIVPGFDPQSPMRLRFPDPACASVPGSEIRPVLVNGMPSPTGDSICAFSYSKYYPLVPSLERANVFGSASFDLTKHTTLFAEVLVNRTRSNSIAAPSYSVPPPLLVVPADHPDNPFGQPATFLGRPFGAAHGPNYNPSGDDTYRILTGMRGDFADVAADTLFESWEWELTASWGVSRLTAIVHDTLREPLTDALNSCSDPSDLSGCFNPFFSAIDGTGTPNSQSVIDTFDGAEMVAVEHALQTYNAGMTGSLFPLPGGDLGIAFGAELRRERRSSALDNDANQERYTFLIGNSDALASRNIYSGYLELRWPLLPGVELNTAARIEHYTDIDNTTPSPFVGLTLVPAEIIGRERAPSIIQKLQFTGQATWAFRAPSLYQAYPGFSVVPTSLPIPGSPVPVFLPVQNFGNPDLEPETALVLSGGFNWQPIDELSLMGEFWNYDYRNRIALESSQQVLTNHFALLMQGMPGDPRVIVDPMTGVIERIQVTQRNIQGHVTTNGIDMGALINLSGESFGGSREDWGTVGFGVQGTLTLSYTYPRELAARRVIPNAVPPVTLDPLGCDEESCEAVGKRNYQTFAPPLPRWRLNFPLQWGLKGHSANVTAHYLSAIEDDNAIAPDGSLGELASIVTFDAQYGYTVRDWFGQEFAFRVGVYNLFDAMPTPTRDINGFETMLYDPRGRMVYAKMSATF